MSLDAEQIHQVAALTAAGRSVRSIASDVGIAPSTVQKVRTSTEAVQLINELRPQIAARLSEKMLDMVEAPDFKPKPQELAVIWGISLDKHDKASTQSQGNVTNVFVAGNAIVQSGS